MDVAGGDSSLVPEEKSSRSGYMYYLSLVVVLIGCTALLLLMPYHGWNCPSHLNDGHWVGDHWHSYHCVLHHYQTNELKSCFEKRSHIVFIGGSTAERYKAIVQGFLHDYDVDALVEYMAYPNLDEEVLKVYYTLAEGRKEFHTPLLVVHTFSARETGLEVCKAKLQKLAKAQVELVKPGGDSTSQQSIPLVLMLSLTTETNEQQECLQYAKQLYSNSSHGSSFYLTLPSLSTTNHHNGLLPEELNLVFNTFCNTRDIGTCCLSGQTVTFSTYFATCILFTILAVYLGVWLVFVSGATFALTPHLEAMSFDFNKFFSILHCVGGVSAVLFFMLLADRLNYFPEINKVSSPQMFIVSVVVVVIVSLATLTKSKAPDFLSHEQVNECRGLMILLLIMIQYTDLEKVYRVYIVNQLLVSGFLFSAGYTFFMYFYSAGDFKCSRLAKVLFQLNLLPLCVCFTMGTSYGAYYLIPLLSGCCVFVYSFMATWPSLSSNRSRYTQPSHVLIVVKFLGVFLLLSILPFAKVLWLKILVLSPVRSVLQSISGDPYHLYYWFYHQRYTVLCGMMCALITKTLKNHFLAIISHYERQIRLLGTGVAVLFLLVYGMFIGNCGEKEQCSNAQAYLDVLPVLSYTFLRNGIRYLQGYHSLFLNQAGSMSVWLFVSHYHFLTANNGQGLLVLWPRLYHVNTVVVVVVYVYLFLIVRASVNTVKKLAFDKTGTATSDVHV